MADAATLSKTLTDSYQEIITGPCMLTVNEGLLVRVSFQSTTPADDTDAYHTTNSFVSYSGGLKVYARIDDACRGTRTKIGYTGV